MTHVRRTVLLAVAAMHVLSTIGVVQAQVSGYNLFEFQLGNTPDIDPRDLTTAFNQLNVIYAGNDIEASLRVEAFASRFSDRDYERLSQYRLTYENSGAEVTVGHFYDILGRGLLLRAFEIPGVVFEDAAFRVRQGFYRDISGVRLGYRNDRFAIKAVRGHPLINVLPPVVPSDERREDLIEALDAQIHVAGASVGGSFLRNNTGGHFTEYAAISASGPLPFGLSAYAELAQQVGAGHPVLDLDEEAAYAVYGSLTFTRGPFGASLEIKDYHDFFLGSGFNDPPSLIKEHPYAVLNRSTHVLNPVDERGVQTEAYYRTASGVLFTANATYATSDFGSNVNYREYYGEVAAPLGDRSAVNLFLDLAEDEFKAEADRFSAGTALERVFPKRWSATLDVEGQTFHRTFAGAGRVTNTVVHLAVSKSTTYTAGVIWERSTDPFLTDRTDTFEVETAPRHWLGGYLGFRPNRHHSLSLFGGQRRGGPACTSGICYDVLDFAGVELRVTTRF